MITMPKYFMKLKGSLFKEVCFEFTLNHTSPTYLKLYDESEVQELKQDLEVYFHKNKGIHVNNK